jgi:hypothetical protein
MHVLAAVIVAGDGVGEGLVKVVDPRLVAGRGLVVPPLEPVVTGDPIAKEK